MQTSLSKTNLRNSKHFHRQSIDGFESRFRANFVNSLSGFKSANLVGTKDSSGKSNVAIFSSAVHLGADPALIGLISRPDNGDRHTLDNIRETEFFTLNHVNETIFVQAHQTSARYSNNESEFEATALSESYLDDFFAPYVGDSQLKIGLKLVDVQPIKANNTALIIGQVEHVYFDDSCLLEDGSIDIEAMNSIAVSGLSSYHRTTKLAKLAYAKKDRILRPV
jgi:flavin reductase (DIM6/NTAB) family NADH-FMN oxidoreductase RutF